VSATSVGPILRPIGSARLLDLRLGGLGQRPLTGLLGLLRLASR
jgi:hypothetical protein